MSLTEQLKTLIVHLQQSIDAANSIMAYVHLHPDSDVEVDSTDSDYASSDEREVYIPSPPVLIRCNAYTNRPGTPTLIPPPAPKTYKKIEIDRFSPDPEAIFKSRS